MEYKATYAEKLARREFFRPRAYLGINEKGEWQIYLWEPQEEKES